jgi:hypothetical protein
MVNHKRKRPRSQRAGCFCRGKLSKVEGRPMYGGNGRELRLRERAKEQ